MKINYFLLSYLYLSLCSPLSALALDHEDEKFNLKANKVILSYTGEALVPARLELNKLDSSVFLINQSENKEIQVEIDFKGKKVHCHSENLKMENETLKTKNPIPPRDFEVLCFPTAGLYTYSVKDTSKNAPVLKGEINVKE